MTDSGSYAEHYRADGLLSRVRHALAAVAPDTTRLTVEQLASLDQFHTRGLEATADLAGAAALRPGETVLDLGCGLGGPARFLSSRHGVVVTGLDLSAAFIETAIYLTERCGLSSNTRFVAGDALAPPLSDGAFDVVCLQHVAMNIKDRRGLYATAFRMLRPGGRLATYDIVSGSDDLYFPVPWARTDADSYLLSAFETRAALVAAGFEITAWWNDSDRAATWFSQLPTASPAQGPNLSLVLGADFPLMVSNLRRNIQEGRAGVLAGVATKPSS